MLRLCRILGTIAVLTALVGTASVAREEPSAGLSTSVAVQPNVQAALWGDMPLYFIENQGQLDPQVTYYVQGKYKTAYFTSQGVTFAINSEHLQPGPAARWVLKVDFAEPNPNVVPEGIDDAGGVVSYFHGSPEEWITGCHTHRKIVYTELWPGIDLQYSGSPGLLKYQFLVKPYADPTQIRLAYQGVETLSINEVGQLEVSTPVGTMNDDTPSAYQEIEGKRATVDVAYTLEGNTYGFEVGPYDPGKPLVIDPEVLIYCGYIGGTGDDVGRGIAVDADGSAYICGETNSAHATFPAAAGVDLGYSTTYDAFVAKLTPDGEGYEYLSFVGGDGSDHCYGIAVDGAGGAYFCGATTSSEATFPAVVGPDLTHNGNRDAFVAKLSPAGTSLEYCGYVGGSRGGEDAMDIAVDSDGSAYITGRTQSRHYEGFPVKIGPDLTYNGEYDDAFVAKIEPDGHDIAYCGYIGGNDGELGTRIDVDSSGRAYVVGRTESSEAEGFPVLVGPDTTFNHGWADAFVARVKTDGTGLEYCGYIGGPDWDSGGGIAANSDGSAWVVGHLDSGSAVSFPVVVGPDLTFNGGRDGFVAKISPDGSTFVSCGYIGGSGDDSVGEVEVDAFGDVYLVGTTESSQSQGFPVAVGPDLTHNGGLDVFVAKMIPSTTDLVSCGYIGGGGFEICWNAVLDGDANLYLVGRTSSSEVGGFPVEVGPDLTYNGGAQDAFVAKVGPMNRPPVADANGPYSANEGSAILLNGSGSYDPDPGDMLTYEWDLDYDEVLFDQDATGPTPLFDAVDLDGPAERVVALRVTDNADETSPVDTATVTISNVPPVVTIGSPASFAIFPVGQPVVFQGSFTDVSADSHTAEWSFDAATIADPIELAGAVDQTDDTVDLTTSFATPGVYHITLKVTDDDNAVGMANTVNNELQAAIVIYDAAGAFVTGGGWIDSPLEAYQPDPSLTGKATFGFVSKYKPGATSPTGQTEFQFKVADLNFHSDTYQWLVVAGARAQFKGTGTINGDGEYGFMLTAIDGQITGGGGEDKFRIKIWDKATDTLVYDNQFGAADDADPSTLLGGGSIVIHKAK